MGSAEYKYKLQGSLDLFGYSMVAVAVVLSLVLLLKMDYWLIGLLPPIVIYSLIGCVIVMVAMFRLTAIEGKLNAMTEEELYRKFVGANSVNKMFYALIPVMFCFAVLIMSACGLNLLDIKPFISIPIAVILLYIVYKVLNRLTFVIFFVSAIYSLSSSAVADQALRELDKKSLPEGYDVNNNLKRLSEKYNKRIKWLEAHVTEENKTEYLAKIDIYNIANRDIEDMLSGIDL